MVFNHILSHSYYAEPFAGGGSIFFVKDKANNNWLNYIDELLINTFNRTGDQKNGKSKQDNFKGERYKGKEIFILNYCAST
ncbi:hypothetical protein [Nostoc sp. UHCC 0252]|uniref:hypothetical protein n=1 Tax=Nostoc sp. UHCC 0252 TaxID=3110241 RepID=UPI002B1FAD5E|nr:hypothetical protein [Nostoc sp. UHCC 0252]MEA5599611.1 hypothetical protein [Nostoc sp. UHCC 0252]